jgi:prepilin-type N-terminal cleavage/methylation domain-containing protein
MKMKVKVKENNRGFSLVELIVVIAIMGILAVTLAPRLTQYLDKARVSSDQEVVNTVYSAVKFAYIQYPSEYSEADSLNTSPLTADTRLELRIPASTNPSETLYLVSSDDKSWTIQSNADYGTTNNFINELQTILGNFTLKSKDVGDNTNITVSITATGYISVTLDYDTSNAATVKDYITVTE